MISADDVADFHAAGGGVWWLDYQTMTFLTADETPPNDHCIRLLPWDGLWFEQWDGDWERAAEQLNLAAEQLNSALEQLETEEA